MEKIDKCQLMIFSSHQKFKDLKIRWTIRYGSTLEQSRQNEGEGVNSDERIGKEWTKNNFQNLNFDKTGKLLQIVYQRSNV